MSGLPWSNRWASLFSAVSYGGMRLPVGVAASASRLDHDPKTLQGAPQEGEFAPAPCQFDLQGLPLFFRFLPGGGFLFLATLAAFDSCFRFDPNGGQLIL